MAHPQHLTIARILTVICGQSERPSAVLNKRIESRSKQNSRKYLVKNVVKLSLSLKLELAQI